MSNIVFNVVIFMMWWWQNILFHLFQLPTVSMYLTVSPINWLFVIFLMVMDKPFAKKANLSSFCLLKDDLQLFFCFEKEKEGAWGGETEEGTGTLSLLLSLWDQWPGLTTSTACTSTLSITTR